MNAKKNTQLTSNEKSSCLMMFSLLLGAPNSSQFYGMIKNLSDGWGISKMQLHRMFDKFVSDKLQVRRKERSDKGENIFNSARKRTRQFTPLNMFKQMRTKQFRDSPERLDEIALKDEFEHLPLEQKFIYEMKANAALARGPYLHDELISLIKKVNGMITFDECSNQLNDIVTKQTVRTYMRSLEGYRMRKTRLLPALDSMAKSRRVVWAQVFWMFWKCMCAINSAATILVLVHMDEKWYFAIKTRTNQKVITSEGCLPKHFNVHHKLHIGKEMYIVCTAFFHIIMT